MIKEESQLVTEFLLEPGEILYREGDLPCCGFIITSGELVLYTEENGIRAIRERRGAGSIVGELSILTGLPRAVTAEALRPCKVYRISANQILHRYDKLDPILRACIETSISFVGKLSSPGTPDCESAPVVTYNLKDASQLIERLKFEQDILNSLKNEDFYLNYQPIVQLTDGEILGFEALMRWEHPTEGNIPPDRFIEVAESMGAICQLTDLALMNACATVRRLLELDQCRDDLFATVNISSQDIARPEFVDFIIHVLDLNNLEPKHIKLELTETELVLNSKPVIETLEKLRNIGLGIAIDDFGTGYSNLSYLKEIPLTALKIDRAFAGDAANNPISFSIVKMIVNLGHELGVRVVAEGLETEADVQTLRDLGCDLAQGYYFAKPMSEEALSDMIQPSADTNRNVA